MNPILDKRCPKCGYLTLCQCNNNIYCLGNDGCIIVGEDFGCIHFQQK